MKNGLKNLYKDPKAAKHYWDSTGPHTLSEEDFRRLKRSLLYDHTWKTTADTLVRLGNIKDGDRVLEAGCGWGRVIIGLKLLCPTLHVVGVDLIGDLLLLAPDAINQELNGDNLCLFAQSSVASLCFTSGHFDAVVSSRVLQYVADPQQVVREFARVVKPGSRVVVLVPNRLNPLVRLHYHTKSYSPSEVESWFRGAGLRIVERGSIGFVPNWHRFSYRSVVVAFNHWLARVPVLNQIGGLAAVAGQKPVLTEV